MIKSEKYILDNGLELVHSQVSNARMATVDVLYDVGSKDESPDHTGFAHLFEHLMFGGSANIPDFDIPCEFAGGENNAWTNEDTTNFYITLPSMNIETALWLESDRMNALSFNPESLRVQKKVVMEEFRERKNEPYRDSMDILRRMAYKTHPYQWLTIGKSLKQIAQTTMEDVKAFFYHHYAPNNATLVLTGDFPFNRAVDLAEKWFGGIPRREIAPRTFVQEKPQTKLRRKTVQRAVPTDAIYMAFHTCPRTDRRYEVFDLVTDLLANGVSGRLPQRLQRQRKLFSQIDAYITEHFDTGLVVITGRLMEGVTFQEAEQAIWDELDDLRVNGATDEEMEKVKNKYESQWILGNLNGLGLACNLAYANLLGEDLNGQVAHYRSISVEEMKRTVSDALVPSNCSVLRYAKK